MTDIARVRMVDVGRFRLRVAVRDGDPRRVPVVLCNGIGTGLESFDSFVAALDPALPVIRFDPPGAGGSPAPTLPYRLPQLARAVTALVRGLGHPRFDVLGISWGGALAQQLAWSAGRRCRRLVLVATGTGAIMVPARPWVLRHLATPRRHRDPAHVRRIAASLYGGAARTNPDLVSRILHEHARAAPVVGYVHQLAAVAGWTSIPFLPWLGQPTLVLSGDDDPIIPTVNGRLLARLIPHAELQVYRGGHLELAAAPDRLVPVVEAFLAPVGTRHGQGDDRGCRP
jgi:poly(3-hydroxyalkanoate) depolymerase